MKKRQIWTCWRRLQIKLFGINEPTDRSYFTPDRGKMEQKRKLAKTSDHGKKHSINPERLAKIAQETPMLTVWLPYGIQMEKAPLTSVNINSVSVC